MVVYIYIYGIYGIYVYSIYIWYIYIYIADIYGPALNAWAARDNTRTARPIANMFPGE